MSASRELLIVRVGAMRVALPSERVRRVVACERPLGAQTSLAVRLGVSGGAEPTRAVVLGTADGERAFAIDVVLAIATVGEDHLLPLPALLRRPEALYSGLAVLADGPVLVVDVAKLLLDSAALPPPRIPRNLEEA